MDGACSTLRQSAPKLRPVELQVISQDVQQRRVGRDINNVLLSVHSQCEGHWRVLPDADEKAVFREHTGRIERSAADPLTPLHQVTSVLVSDKLLTRSPSLSVLRAASVTLPAMLSELVVNALVMKVLQSITLVLTPWGRSV